MAFQEILMIFSRLTSEWKGVGRAVLHSSMRKVTTVKGVTILLSKAPKRGGIGRWLAAVHHDERENERSAHHLQYLMS